MAKEARRKFDARTMMLVSVVTLLVWLLAESRTVRLQIMDVSPRIETGAELETIARAAPGQAWPESVQLTLSGSTAGLDQVGRSLQGRVLLRVGFEVPASPGVHEIDLREVLRVSDILTQAGVAIDEVNPNRVWVEVDDVRTGTLPVRVIEPDGVAFETNAGPRAVPASLSVRGPASVLARLQGAEGIVRLDPGAMARLRPGIQETLELQRVELPEDLDRWATEFEPEFVDVSLTLRSRTQSLVLDAMPIQVMIAPGEIGRWRVTLLPGAQDLVGIEVTGPSDQIERLRSREVIPTALIALTFNELERGVETKRAQILGLPPGVQIVAGTDMTVRLVIGRADGPEPEQP